MHLSLGGYCLFSTTSIAILRPPSFQMRLRHRSCVDLPQTHCEAQILQVRYETSIVTRWQPQATQGSWTHSTI